jgi:DNA-binding transcriptional regulator YiaG
MEMFKKFERSPLKKLRVKRFMTQKQLGKALGVTEMTVSNWESGRSVPKLTPVQYKKWNIIIEAFYLNKRDHTMF